MVPLYRGGHRGRRHAQDHAPVSRRGRRPSARRRRRGGRTQRSRRPLLHDAHAVQPQVQVPVRDADGHEGPPRPDAGRARTLRVGGRQHARGARGARRGVHAALAQQAAVVRRPRVPLMDGFGVWSFVASFLNKHHLLEDGSSPGARRPITIVAAFPLLTSSDIFRRGMFVELSDKTPPDPDPIMRLDLSSRYARSCGTCSSTAPSTRRGRPAPSAPRSTGFRSVLRLSALRRVWFAAQKHLRLGELDVAASGERPTPRAPNHVDPNHDHWKQVSLDWAPARLFEPLADEDVPGDDVRPPAVTFTSGWNDIFCNETVDDYCAPARTPRRAACPATTSCTCSWDRGRALSCATTSPPSMYTRDACARWNQAASRGTRACSRRELRSHSELPTATAAAAAVGCCRSP